ncbi:MAG TPA: SPFH domain-containing protein [Phycisphaerae bacterium]|nr:SPFH domain-containing protein [Phycisphaerae bacterium]HNU44943.1 SPFH domain-containing protein [Phycisphaerae bacterium]
MTASRELEKRTFNGWLVLALLFLTGVALGWSIYWHARRGRLDAVWLTVQILLVTVWAFLQGGFFTLQPNQAAVLILFGKYSGTARRSGFHWANPLLTKKKVSLRARNLNMDTIKVNDLRGNPIEIAAVVVWRVHDSAQAVFDVDDFESYVSVQSEAALRHLASAYPYDTGGEEAEQLTLRGSMDEVSRALTVELQERVARAGVQIEEARLSHLAYAPEIAGAMLQRQQAEAIVAARSRIVDGAVGMVEMALAKLEERHTVELDEERKAAMVSNLLVVLCGDKAAHPVVNAGTLYG